MNRRDFDLYLTAELIYRLENSIEHSIKDPIRVEVRKELNRITYMQGIWNIYDVLSLVPKRIELEMKGV